MTEMAPGSFLHEPPITHTDGTTVQVWWDETYWVAEVEGIKHSSIGTGNSRMLALIDLAHALAATMNAMDAITPDAGGAR